MGGVAPAQGQIAQFGGFGKLLAEQFVDADQATPGHARGQCARDLTRQRVAHCIGVALDLQGDKRACGLAGNPHHDRWSR